MIKIIDNFFDDKDLKAVQDFALNRAFYTPKFFENTTEKSKKNFYGNRWYLNNDENLKQLFIKQAELKFDIKINELQKSSGIDQRNLDHFQPHIDDDSKINILIMIHGPTAVSNGTVFYHGDVNDCVLDMHVGFRENRAILFPSDFVHSPHLSKIPNLKRYTATLFVTDYD